MRDESGVTRRRALQLGAATAGLLVLEPATTAATAVRDQSLLVPQTRRRSPVCPT